MLGAQEWDVFAAAVLCSLECYLLPKESGGRRPAGVSYILCIPS